GMAFAKHSSHPTGTANHRSSIDLDTHYFSPHPLSNELGNAVPVGAVPQGPPLWLLSWGRYSGTRRARPTNLNDPPPTTIASYRLTRYWAVHSTGKPGMRPQLVSSWPGQLIRHYCFGTIANRGVQNQERALKEIEQDQARMRANLKEVPPTSDAYERYVKK